MKTLFEMINKTTEVTGAAVAAAWSNTIGEVNDRGSYANLDSWRYFEALLDNGELLRCRWVQNDSATISYGDHHKGNVSQRGTASLPDNWVSISLVTYRYTSNNDKRMYPNGIVVARNNNDGTAQVYNTISGY